MRATLGLPLRRASDLADFLDRPMASYLVGSTYAYFYIDPGFTGLSVWGIPSLEETTTLNKAMDVVVGKHGAAHLSLVDSRRLARVDPITFATMAKYVGDRREVFGRLIRRQAMICSEGLAGAVVAGFFTVLRPAYPYSVFYRLEEALSWLDNPHGGDLVTELLASLERTALDDPLIHALRQLLVAPDRRYDVSTAARGLGVSTRTLQRKLQQYGTSFQRELQAAQMQRAQEMMLHSSQSLSEIALEVGFSSLQHFSTVFHKVTGKTPRHWRREQEGSR